MIGQLLSGAGGIAGDALLWFWEHPHVIAAAFVGWMVSAVGFAIVVGRAMAAAEYEDSTTEPGRWVV